VSGERIEAVRDPNDPFILNQGGESGVETRRLARPCEPDAWIGVKLDGFSDLIDVHHARIDG